MDKRMVEDIRQNWASKSSDDLLRIWKENDREQWSDAAFEAAREILTERGFELPPQDPAKVAKPKVVPKMSTLLSKPDIRKAGLKNLALSGSWFVISVVLLFSGLAMQINQACLWPSRALSESGALSGRWRALIPLLSLVGSIIWLTIMVGWVISIPNALFMVLTGKESRTLDKFFPVFFKAPRSTSSKEHNQGDEK